MDGLTELLELYRKKYVEKSRQEETASIICYVIGAVIAAVAVAGIIYALYRFFKPDPVDDFDDDFEDDFDDDFFEDEEVANGTGA